MVTTKTHQQSLFTLIGEGVNLLVYLFVVDCFIKALPAVISSVADYFYLLSIESSIPIVGVVVAVVVAIDGTAKNAPGGAFLSVS